MVIERNRDITSTIGKLLRLTLERTLLAMALPPQLWCLYAHGTHRQDGLFSGDDVSGFKRYSASVSRLVS
jgi:hypothetical protein